MFLAQNSQVPNGGLQVMAEWLRVGFWGFLVLVFIAVYVVEFVLALV